VYRIGFDRKPLCHPVTARYGDGASLISFFTMSTHGYRWQSCTGWGIGESFSAQLQGLLLSRPNRSAYQSPTGADSWACGTAIHGEERPKQTFGEGQ
jgi:hypothetical protein